MDIELSSVIHDSFKSNPEVMMLHSVTDVKGWMHDQISPLHDHLKAHQFKFEKDCHGHCRMFYKEWSTDEFWLPQAGLSILPMSNSTPCLKPCVLPCYDPDNLKRLESTLSKVCGFLDKVGVSSWWAAWLEETKKNIVPQQPKEMQGKVKIKVLYSRCS